MRRWFVLLFILGIAALPFSAHAQSAIKFSTLQVELRPEYDEPSMLLIYDFQLASGASLPVDVTFRIPKDDNLVAVAYLSNGQLLNAGYNGPTVDNDWQIIQDQSPNGYNLSHRILRANIQDRQRARVQLCVDERLSDQ